MKIDPELARRRKLHREAFAVVELAEIAIENWMSLGINDMESSGKIRNISDAMTVAARLVEEANGE